MWDLFRSDESIREREFVFTVGGVIGEHGDGHGRGHRHGHVASVERFE
jgi:hypothetical protein